MKKLKVLTVVGTRPEIIRLACVLQKLDASEAIEHVLVHTGQNYDYELNEVFFEDLGLRKPDHFLNAAGKNATETAGQILINIDQNLTGGLCGVLTCSIQKMIRFAQTQVLEEYFVQLIIIILTGMHQDMLNGFRCIQLLQHTGQTDDLRTCTYYGQYF